MSGDFIELYGISVGKAGKANVFKADTWADFEFLPASNSWFTPDPLAEEPGRGTMKIAGWLARKNKWTEMGEPPCADANTSQPSTSSKDATEPTAPTSPS